MSTLTFTKLEIHPILKNINIVYFTIVTDSSVKFNWFDCVETSLLGNPQEYIELNKIKYLDDIDKKLGLYTALSAETKKFVSSTDFVKPKLLSPTSLEERLELIELRLKTLEEK